MVSRRTYVWSALALAAILFAGLNVFVDNFITTARLDLTQNGQFTLSQGTRNIIANLQEPVTLKFYYSKTAGAAYASTEAYAKRVRDLLGEYAALSHGKIILQEIDPEPFTPQEDEASADGLTPAPTDTGDVVYFGLAGSNSIDGKAAIPYFATAREPYLEYDVSALIYHLATPKKPIVGMITSLPLTGTQQNPQPMAAYAMLAQEYRVAMVPDSFSAIPATIDLLLIAHPQQMSPSQLRAIDQYVLKGGKALIFVDPLSEMVQQANNPDLAPSSDLAPLLASWGVQYNSNLVVLDQGTAIRVATSDDPRNPSVAYPLWLHLTTADFNLNDPITASLQTVNLASVGAIQPAKGATTHFNTLLATSNQTTELSRNIVAMVHNPQQLSEMVSPTGRRLAIAARVNGMAKSAFPANGAPGSVAQGNINVVVVADTDLFDDRFWVNVSNQLGQNMAVPFADNGAFILNAVENLTGSQDLISLRTRTPGERPFTVVQQLQAAAEIKYRETEQVLQSRLDTAEHTLTTLQQGNSGKGVALTPAEQTEIEKTRLNMAETRTQLRAVQHNLRADIDRLGGWLAFINIALVPLLVAGFALVMALLRRKRRARAARGARA